MKIALGISGASAVNLGIKLMKYLNEISELHCVISQGALRLIKAENININLSSDFKIYKNSSLQAPISSGSFGVDVSFICPCSINTLAKINAGISDSLITRMAAVALKEKKKLILGVREMPFSSINLKHMANLSNMGVIIAPPVLGYYAGAKSIDEMENFIIGKWLDSAGIENNLFKRWK